MTAARENWRARSTFRGTVSFPGPHPNGLGGYDGAMRRPLPFPTPLRAGALAALALLFAARSDAAQSREIDLTTATIAEINEAVDAGVLTAERLVELCLARIAAYDDQGPRINAVISVNPNARERARELDAERERSGRRSPLHGIPVLLKDNFDTADIPTTAGSFLLQDSRPPDDAFVVRKLREAGAIVLAKVNLSEFASGGAMSSLGGITRNPHDPTRTPPALPAAPARRWRRRTALSGWVRTPGARSAAPPPRTGWRASNRRSGS